MELVELLEGIIDEVIYQPAEFYIPGRRYFHLGQLGWIFLADVRDGSSSQRLTRDRFMVITTNYLALVRHYGPTEIRFEATGVAETGVLLYFEFLVWDRASGSAW